jgi:hypothetical protein
MGLGAVVAVLAIVAVIALAPWKKTGATPAKADAPMTQPAVQPPVAEPAAPVAAQPEPQPQLPSAPVSTPVSTPGNAGPRVASRPPGVAKPGASAVSQPALQTPLQQSPAQQPVVQQQPVRQQPAPPVGPSRAELQEVRESISLAGTRAAVVHTSLQSLQSSQAASGMNLRADIRSAASLMDTYLNGAEAALNAGDVVKARDFMDKAEPQVQKLEKFFNIK